MTESTAKPRKSKAAEQQAKTKAAAEAAAAEAARKAALTQLNDSEQDDLNDLIETLSSAPAAAQETPAAQSAPLSELEALSALMSDVQIQDTPKPEDQPANEPAGESAIPVVGKKKNQPSAEATKPPKAERPPVHASASAKLSHRLGDKAESFLLLDASETVGIVSDPAKLKAYQAELMKSIDALGQIKVKEKVVQLFGWLANGGKLNEVMRRAFVVLARDGELMSGEKGNMHLDLLQKPYSVGTARAQSGQIFSLFPALKIVTRTDRGFYKLNKNSIIFQQVKERLQLVVEDEK